MTTSSSPTRAVTSTAPTARPGSTSRPSIAPAGSWTGTRCRTRPPARTPPPPTPPTCTWPASSPRSAASATWASPPSAELRSEAFMVATSGGLPGDPGGFDDAVGLGIEAGGVAAEAPGGTGPEGRVAALAVEVPAGAAARRPHGAGHGPLDAGVPSGFDVLADLDDIARPADVTDGVEDVGDLGLDHENLGAV